MTFSKQQRGASLYRWHKFQVSIVSKGWHRHFWLQYSIQSCAAKPVHSALELKSFPRLRAWHVVNDFASSLIPLAQGSTPQSKAQQASSVNAPVCQYCHGCRTSEKLPALA